MQLQPSTEDLHDAGHFAESEHLAARNVANVNLSRHARVSECNTRYMGQSADLAEKRDEMVLAEREDVNVLDDDHFVVVLAEYRPIDDLCECAPRSGRRGTGLDAVFTAVPAVLSW